MILPDKKWKLILVLRDDPNVVPEQRYLEDREIVRNIEKGLNLQAGLYLDEQILIEEIENATNRSS